MARRVRQAGACRKFLGIELEAVRIPGGPDLRPIFALYHGTASAQREESCRWTPGIGPVKASRATTADGEQSKADLAFIAAER